MPRTIHRSARVGIRTTPAQRRRLFGLLVSAGDVWAWVIDCNRTLRDWGCPQVVNFPALCRELTGVVFGELPRISAEDILKQYSAAWIEAAKRRKGKERAGSPRRKRRLHPVRFRKGTFVLKAEGSGSQLRGEILLWWCGWQETSPIPAMPSAR